MQKSPTFELKLAGFGAFWELILLQLNCLSYTHKPASLDFGLQNLLLYHSVPKSGGDFCMTVPFGLKSGDTPPPCLPVDTPQD